MYGLILGIDNIKIFSIFFDVVLEYQETVELFANETGVKISLLDRSHSCFYEVFYENDFFEYFEVEGNEVISLFIEDLQKILKTARKGEVLTLSSNEQFVIAKFEKGDSKRVFELVQSENFGETPPAPSIDLECSFITDMDDLERTFKDLDIIKTNAINFAVKGDSLILSTTETAQTRYSHTIDVICENSAVSRYSINYLKDIVKFKKIDPLVSIELGDSMPLIWSCETNHMVVRGLVAPLMEVED